jgi:hypothetical protein
MDKQLYIPKRINVGFQERHGTYTGLLAFVIYWDDKGKLRQETSWNSWRHKPEAGVGRRIYNAETGYYSSDSTQEPYGDKVKPQAFDNVPTEGFVLNKKVGGHSSGWNHRQTYCRVYDPRGFEFEITMENLLFILQETNSVVGKGLEGEFVYSWDGKHLVLLPACSQDYKISSNFTDLQKKKVTKKDMVAGCAYTDKNQTKLVYLGRFDHHTYEWVHGDNSYDRSYHTINSKKQHVFYNLSYIEDDNTRYRRKSDKVNVYDKYVVYPGFTKLGTRDTETPVDNYAELMEEYSTSKYGSKPTAINGEVIEVTLPEPRNRRNYPESNAVIKDVYIKKDVNNYQKVDVIEVWDWEKKGSYYNSDRGDVIFKGYYLQDGGTYKINDKGEFMSTYGRHRYYDDIKNYQTKDDIESFTFYDISVDLENINNLKIENYY